MCECHCGVLYIDYDSDMGLSVSMFERNAARSWCNRVRLAWSALRGQPYTDMVILNNQQIADLVDQLTSIQNRSDYNL